MARFVEDSFTGTSGALTSHTGETGATWTKIQGGTDEPQINGSGKLIAKTSGADATIEYAYASGTPAGAEYDVVADFYVASNLSADLSGVFGRFNTGTPLNGYRLAYYQSDGQWSLFKFVAGSATSLGTYTQTLTVGQTYTIKLEIRNATKKVFIDGVERISSADNAITGAGKAGVVTRQSASSTGYQLDSVYAEDAGAAPADPIVLFMRVRPRTDQRLRM